MKPTVGLRFGQGKLVLLAVAAVFSLVVYNTSAQVETLTDGNSSVTLNPSTSTGMNNWTIDGVNVLNQQWFWYRVGPSGSQATVNTIGTPTVNKTAANQLTTLYTGSQFSLQAVYSLVGGANGSGTADLGEQIKIQNNTGTALNFYFFQYAYFNIPNSVVQLGKNVRGLYNEAYVSSGTVNVTEALDTGISPGANYGEAGVFPSTLNSLNGTPGYILSDVNSASGNATWAFEWGTATTTIAPNGTLIISKDLNIAGVTPVPEPPTWSLVSIGLIGFGMLRHYRGRRG
jgi:hypothetical protein